MSSLTNNQNKNKKGVNPFSITVLDDRYVISPVQYRNGLYEVAWSKELLDGGNIKIQDQWIEHLEDSEWFLPSCPLYHATFATLYHEREGSNGMVGILRDMFKADFNKYEMMTSTRIKYQPQGMDKVIHDYESSSKWKLDVGIVGSTGLLDGQGGFENTIEPLEFENTIEALLGTRNLTESEEIYKWVSDNKPYFWGLNPKSKKETKRVLMFGGHDYIRFNIADWDIYEARHARGVVSRKISRGSRGNRK